MPENVLTDRLDRGEEGNKINSLDRTEKEALQNLDVTVIEQQEKDIGDEKFTVGSEEMNLRDIVQKFDKATNTVNGVKVENKSDLAAAIQVYVLATGNSISPNPVAYNNEAKGIDGIIGANTKKGIGDYKKSLDNTNNDNKASEKDETKEEQETLRADIGELVYGKVGPYLEEYKDPKYNLVRPKSAGLQNEGKLMVMNDQMVDGEKVTIRYTSAIDKKPQLVVVDASNCKMGAQYSVNKFGKAIEDAIAKNEASLQAKENDKKAKETTETENAVILSGINKFDEKTVSNKVLRKYLVENKHNFKVRDIDKNRVSFDSDKGAILSMERNKLLANGKFNSKAFENKIQERYGSDAKKYVMKEIEKTEDGMPTVGSLNGIGAVDAVIRRYNNLITEVGSYGSDFAGKKAEIQGRQTEYQNHRNYLQLKTSFETATANVKKIMEGVSLDQFDAKFDLALKEIEKCVTVQKVDASHYNLVYRDYNKEIFNKDKKDAEYKKMVEELVKPISTRLVTFNHVID